MIEFVRNRLMFENIVIMHFTLIVFGIGVLSSPVSFCCTGFNLINQRIVVTVILVELLIKLWGSMKVYLSRV